MSHAAAALLMIKGHLSEMPEGERALVLQAVQRMRDSTIALSEEQADIARTYFSVEVAAKAEA